MAKPKQFSNGKSAIHKKPELTEHNRFLSRVNPSAVCKLMTFRQRVIRKCGPALRLADDFIASVRPDLNPARALNLVITGRCNIHCAYCDYPIRYRGQNEMSGIEWINIISDAIASGIKSFGIMGGEPLLCRDWPQIAEACLPTKPFLVTNGILIDRDLAEKVGKMFCRVKVSLDAANSETYQKVRNNKRFYDVLRAIELLVKSGVGVNIGYVILDKNVADIVSAADLAASLGCTISYSIVGFENNNKTATQDRTLRDKIDKNIMLDMLSRVAHMPHVALDNKVIEFLLNVRPKRCYSVGLLIDPLGDVYPCCGPTPPIGNLRNDSWHTILSIWRAGLAKYRLMKADGCQRCDAAVSGFRFLRRALWRR